MKERSAAANALFAILWWALLAGVTFLCSVLMYSFGTEIGSDGSGFLPITLVRPNYICYFGGLAFWIASCVCIWRRLLRPTLEASFGGAPLLIVIWAAEALLGLFAQLMAAVAGMVVGADSLFMGLRPEILDYFFFFSAIFPAVLIVADLLIRHFHNKQQST